MAGAEVIERSALPLVDLAHVVPQLDGEAALDQSVEGAAGGQLRQLAGVAYEHELPASVWLAPAGTI